MKEMALLFGALLIALGLFAYLVPVNTEGKPNVADVQDGAEENAEENKDKADAKSADDEATDGKKKKTSFTALIPAAFGCLFLLCGTLAYLGEGARKHAMHVAAGFALVFGLLGLGRGIAKIGTLTGDDPTAQRATLITLIMGGLCLVYLVLSVRSFIAAKKARLAAADESKA